MSDHKQEQHIANPISAEAVWLPTPLPKHAYPVFIRLFFGSIFFVSCIVIVRFLIYDLPKHHCMYIQLRRAKTAFDNGNYEQSIDVYKNIVAIYPSFKAGKIVLAKSLFARCAQTGLGAYFQFGMWFLDGNTYTDSEISAMQKYVPIEYMQDFKDAWKYT